MDFKILTKVIKKMLLFIFCISAFSVMLTMTPEMLISLCLVGGFGLMGYMLYKEEESRMHAKALEDEQRRERNIQKVKEFANEN